MPATIADDWRRVDHGRIVAATKTLTLPLALWRGSGHPAKPSDRYKTHKLSGAMRAAESDHPPIRDHVTGLRDHVTAAAVVTW